MTRNKARETAFALVFERGFRETNLQNAIRSAVVGREIALDDYAHNVAEQVYENLALIDQKIEKHLTEWKIDRLSKTTLAVLRLAIGEIDYVEDVPTSVSINEAVELAKKFGNQDDASFINGVLGAYVKGKNKE